MQSFLIYSFLALAFGGLISLALSPRATVLRRFLRSSPLQYIGKISLTGKIEEHLYPTPNRFVSYLGGLAIGTDGNIYFSQTNPVQDGVGVFLRLDVDVRPARVNFSGIGESRDLTVTETHHVGGWTASTSNSNVATVAQGGAQNIFTVTATGSGTATISISDSRSNEFDVPVTVP